jgi:hypothetical protein
MVILFACQENTVEPQTFGTINGSVTNEDFSPLANVQITTVPPTSVVLTDSGGVFVVEGVVPGEYSVFAEKADYQRTSLKVSITVDQTSQATFTLAPEPLTFGQLSGQVVDAISNQPISNVSITTRPPTSALLTDGQGRVVIDSVPEAIYTIIAKKVGYQTDSVTISLTVGKGNPFALPLSPTDDS